MSRTVLDIHILQNVPPSNINRDDTGSPKTAVYGGVQRSRVSSQAWKRATRKKFQEDLAPEELAVRTKKVAEYVAERILEHDGNMARETAWDLAAKVIKAATGATVEVSDRKKKKAKDEDHDGPLAPESKYLMFLSRRQRDALGDLAHEGKEDITAFLKDKDVKKRAKDLADTGHSIDIALFGRMVADGADVNVDAATQVAHALSVHEVDNESDYYTAVDDQNPDEETGAGMIGTVDFNSATLYRYAAVDVDRLAETLGKGMRDDQPGSEPVRRAVEAFVRGFVESMPSGKANTFGNHTLPETVVVKVRSARPISFVGAFEKPVTSTHDSGYMEEAVRRLTTHAERIEAAYGDGDAQGWAMSVSGHPVSGLGDEVGGLKELVTLVGETVAQRRGTS